ncbi:MAG: acetylornithine/succinylornithine family transaminase [Proteobacteria bacterium]|nr:acetylornithine/succinylornithine family transaminase [Pseudomonadota bacterium]
MNSKELLEIAEGKLLNIADRPDIVMARGQGMVLYDTEGNEYLDFIGGWAVNCLGHSPEAISEALARQSEILVNSSPAFYNLPMLEYAELLVDHCCLDRAFFTSTGAEANEGAIKLARKYGSKVKNGASDIITTQLGFHGRTLTTMSATGKDHWEDLYEPKSKGFQKSIFNDIDSVRRLISEKTCAIMIEPIQGEGGVNVATDNYMKELRAICSGEDILLIFDEIQTGMGRTGTLFCYEHYGIEPDIMTLAKGIGGGFPLSAVLAKERLNIFDPGDQGGTYTGQPLAMSVGSAVLKELLDRNLVENSRQMGDRIVQGLHKLSKRYEIGDIRGKGLLIAFDLLKTDAAGFVDTCLQDGLLVNSPKPQTIRLMPPLVVTEPDIERLFQVVVRNLAAR